MKFKLLFATVALSAVMAVPSQDSFGLTTNGPSVKNNASEETKKPEKPRDSGYKFDIKSHISPESYKKLLLEKKIDGKIPGITEESKERFVQKAVSSIHKLIIGFCNEKIPPFYEKNKEFIDSFALSIADSLAKEPDRIPKFSELTIAHFKKNPDKLSYFQTNLEFIKELKSGPVEDIKADIFAKIRKRQPTVAKQIKDSVGSAREIGLYPEEYYQRFLEY
ncbi:hypothetical protein K502DRAFT_348919 [Neoconidiobolus thromboides FSU 785]|nr:hypothetical protein K502DRAFT_348919 [Neoconidiobolus thromboides FSU 785]